MNTAGIRDDDIVQVDRLGRRFEAVVAGREPDGRRLSIRPLRPAISYMSAGAREIICHWRARPYTAAGRVSMRPIRVGDMVKFRVGDCTAFGTVHSKQDRRLNVSPLKRSSGPQAVVADDVVRHYARHGRRPTA